MSQLERIILEVGKETLKPNHKVFRSPGTYILYELYDFKAGTL